MKFLVALAALFVAVNAVTIEEKWTAFKATHLKEYHPKEEQKRLATFQENLKRIEEHNAKYENGTVGPVSVAVAANNEWQLYGGGVLDLPNCNSHAINHGVLVVGYDHESSDYWIIKNSWGIYWGEEGYIRLSRGSNQCHISEVASYPQL